MRPSRRAGAVWGLFACLTSAALCLAPLPVTSSAGWRLLAVLAAVAMGWLAGAPILTGRGRYAVRSFCWLPDGTWRLVRPDGRPETAHLTPATATLGPWLLLAWRADGAGPVWRRLRYALLDVSDVGLSAFRALRGRLRLEAVSTGGAADTAPRSS